MTLEEIFDTWMGDSKINPTELGDAALDIPKLHHKYFRMMSGERMVLRKLEADFNTLMYNKRQWANGDLTREELQALNWTPILKRMMKSEQEDFLRVDPDVVKATNRIALQKEKLEALDSIIKMINNRSFQISNAINWAKFKVGM
jgi:hypothetical protein